MLGPTPEFLIHQVWVPLRIHTSKFPGDDDAGPAHFENHFSRKISAHFSISAVDIGMVRVFEEESGT